MNQFRHRVAGAVAFTCVGLTAMVALLYILTRPTGRPVDFMQVLKLSLEAQAQTTQQLHDAADVIVFRETSGALLVSGRAVRQRVRLKSLEQLKALLVTLPRPGVALLTVAYQPTTTGVNALFQGPPPAIMAAEREIKAVLEEAGFQEPRGSVKTFLPLDRALLEGRPTMR